jgi:uncharacterized membrane protein YraQ (UPF0718 family)
MIFLILVTISVVLISFFLDREKTFTGLKKGLRMFVSILPELLNILILVSVVLYLIPQSMLIRLLGRDSGMTGISIAALTGSISLIPGFIAYPLAAILLKSGVSYGVLAVFITTLMMVGVVTLPLEAKYFGLKTALLRNGLSFLGALIIGILVGVFM